MAVISIRVLMIGNPSGATAAMLFRLGMRGWGAQHVDSAAEARQAMETYRFSAVLASEVLPDGRGYDLARIAQRQFSYLYVGIPLSETLWLPVVERGAFVLGERALSANVFENELEAALGSMGSETRAEENGTAEADNGTSHRLATVRRRGTAAA